MEKSELSKICIFMVITLLSQVQPQLTFSNDNMPTDDELISLSASSPSPPPYPENPEYEDDDTFSPQSESDHLLSPSPSPYIDVAEAPEILYESYPPTQSPAPSTSSDAAADEGADYYYYSPSLAPQPDVLSFNYRAEDDSVLLVGEDSEDAYYSDQNKRGPMVGFVLGAVCLVGLGGFVYKKKKNGKSKSDYEYELAKREDKN